MVSFNFFTMKNTLAFLFLFCFNASLSYSQTPGMSKKKISDDISMLVADNLIQMEGQEAATKFKTARPPIAAFSTEDQLVDFVVNYSNTNWGKDDVELMKSFYKSTISGLYTDIQYERDEVKQIEGRDFAVFEFVALVKPPEGSFVQRSGQKYYNYIMYTIYAGRAYVFNFSCPNQLRSDWQELVPRMMQSVHIK